jgi:cytochrome P450
MILLLIGSTILGLIIIIYLKVVRPQKRLYDAFRAQGIVGEPFIPVIGQAFDMIRASKENRAVEYYYELSQKHGYCFLFGMGPFTRLVLLEPELIGDFLARSKGDIYQRPPFLTNIVKPLIGVHNLLVSREQEHERARKMLNPAFHFVNLRSIVSIMSSETGKSIDSLLSTYSSTNEVKMDIEFNALTFSIIASSAFGQSFETMPGAKESMSHAFNEVKEAIAYRTLRLINQVKFLDQLPFWGKRIIDEGAKKLNELVDQAINDRRNGKSMSLCSGQDILDLLLSAIDEKGEPFSDQQIKDEALTFVLAGHETTGGLMTWVIYILMTHEDVLQACREEVDRILPNGTIPTFEHMADLQVIEAVLYETLRLYPSAPLLARECTKQDTLSSASSKHQIDIPVGMMIIVHIYALHRRKEYWPRPLEFDYKRWMRDPVTGLKPKLPHPYAYLPFGQGSRNCIGQNFALLEAKVILAMFVQSCEFKLVPGQIIVPETDGVTMMPKYGMLINLKKRNLY